MPRKRLEFPVPETSNVNKKLVTTAVNVTGSATRSVAPFNFRSIETTPLPGTLYTPTSKISTSSIPISPDGSRCFGRRLSRLFISFSPVPRRQFRNCLPNDRPRSRGSIKIKTSKREKTTKREGERERESKCDRGTKSYRSAGAGRNRSFEMFSISEDVL